MTAQSSLQAGGAERWLSVARGGWPARLGVTFAYLTGRFAAAAVVAATSGAGIAFDPVGELTAAFVVGSSVVWLAPRVAGTARRRAATLGLLLFASVAAVMIEGSAYAPSLSPLDRLPIGLVLQLGVSLVTAWVAVISRASGSASIPPARRGAVATTARLLAAALVYVVAYFVTGAINFALVTGPYYVAHAGGLTTPPPSMVLALALGEGLLLTLGAIPFATAVTGSRRARAITCGLALWVLGGVVPLLQEANLPDVLRAASVVEIFFQKVPLGIAIVWLFGSRRRAESSRQRGGRQMQGIQEAASAFLANKRVAVTGVSRHPENHGSNAIYRRLRERGYQVFAVNPNAREVEGDPSYPDLRSIPGGVAAVVIATRPEFGLATMRECVDLGVKHVWMHHGPGASSVSAEATDLGRQHGITVIDGGCPLMFAPAADFGHRVLRFVYRGRVPKEV